MGSMNGGQNGRLASFLHVVMDSFVGWSQALMLTEFQQWPRDSITVEFWMMSVDKCRKGVPFSYATGGYEQADNSFLILNYNDWCADQAANKSPCSMITRQIH